MGSSPIVSTREVFTFWVRTPSRFEPSSSCQGGVTSPFRSAGAGSELGITASLDVGHARTLSATFPRKRVDYVGGPLEAPAS